MRLEWIGFFLLGAVGCFEEQPCDNYIAYICDCHGSDECASAEGLAGAGPALQDQCALDLPAVQEADVASGFECVGGVSDTGDTGAAASSDLPPL